MALRGTLTHRKTRRLAAALGIYPCFALGIEEGLWHVTAEQSPSGDIGRLSDEDIAEELFYGGDPGGLIRALVAAGFLEEHPLHRLIVHDWHVHSDDATDNKLSRAGLRYANGDLPRMRRLSKEERGRAIARYSETCEFVRTEYHNAAQIDIKSHFQSQSQSQSPEPDGFASPSALPKAKRGCRLPEDFAVTDEHRHFTQKNSLPDPDSEIDRFRDHWKAKAGKDGVKSDWDATFRNWLRNAATFARTSARSGAQDRSERADAAMLAKKGIGSTSGAVDRVARNRSAFRKAAERDGIFGFDGFAGVTGTQSDPQVDAYFRERAREKRAAGEPLEPWEVDLLTAVPLGNHSGGDDNGKVGTPAESIASSL